MIAPISIDQHRLSVAPMMRYTDKHCRYFHRCLAPHAALYTEMITADAIIHGPRDRLLCGHHLTDGDDGIILQLGGACPESMGAAVKLAENYHFAEYNLNVGCPSDRVRSGCFGAALMGEPSLVAELLTAMREQTAKPVTVKCRIGIDDMDVETGLDAFVDVVAATGVKHLAIHARKAWLKGLSPAENREIPPLDYDRVFRLKKRRPDLRITINGGFVSLADIRIALDHVDGVMLGREAYQNPLHLARIAADIYGTPLPETDYVIDRMADYADRQIADGEKLIAITRHMLGMFNGRPHARRWRRTLSTDARFDAATGDLIRRATIDIAQPLTEAA